MLRQISKRSYWEWTGAAFWYGQCNAWPPFTEGRPNFTLSDSNSTSVSLATTKQGSPSDFWATGARVQD